MTLKPIETVYKGYRFRSRLEARWAVFLDTIGWDWRYDDEGYDLDGEWYLPDFRLLDVAEGTGLWLEIMGVKPEEDGREFQLARKLALHGPGGVAVAWGDCALPMGDVGFWLFDHHGDDTPGAFGACCRCGAPTVFATPVSQCLECGGAVSALAPTILAGYDAARQARFEHGAGT